MPLSLLASPVHSGLFSDDSFLPLLDDAADISHMVRFERALAIVQGKLGIIPAEAAEVIATRLLDAAPAPLALQDGTTSAGVPVPALVAELRKIAGEDAGKWLHWGATSQDVMDTAQMLQIKACLQILEARLDQLIGALETQSRENADRLMAGRTRSQVATPVTLGYRIAQWAHPLIDAENGLSGLKKSVLRLQFGGASGINGAIAPDGPQVAQALALELGLEDGPSWHVNRSPLQELAAWLQRVSAALSKMAGDLILLGRSDIGEVASGSGGGSSTMPQKANPVQAEAILVLAQIVNQSQSTLAAASDPVEERDGTKWPLEWMKVPQMLMATGTALRHAQALADSLRPNSARLDATLSENPEIMAETASFALAKAGVPRAEAKNLVGNAAADTTPFADALAKLSPVEIDWHNVLDPRSAIQPSRDMSDRIFAKRERT